MFKKSGIRSLLFPAEISWKSQGYLSLLYAGNIYLVLRVRTF